MLQWQAVVVTKQNFEEDQNFQNQVLNEAKMIFVQNNFQFTAASKKKVAYVLAIIQEFLLGTNLALKGDASYLLNVMKKIEEEEMEVCLFCLFLFS
jgi:hypothetical protein